MIKLLLPVALSVLGLAIAGCHPFASTTPSEGLAVGGTQSPSTLKRKASSAIVLNVKWPDRQVQAIPSTTTTLEFLVYPMGDVAASFTHTVARPSASNTSQVVLSPLRPGDVVVSVLAKDGEGTVVGAGSAHFELEPNTRKTGGITVQSSATASVAAFYPEVALPGQRVAVFGAGLPSGMPSATIGGASVLAVTPVNSGLVYLDVPALAGNGAVTVASATSASSFTTIRSLSIVSPFTELFLRGKRELEIEARDVNGALIADVEADDVPWEFVSRECLDCNEYPPGEEEEEEEEEEEGPEVGGQPFAEVEDGELIAGENRERFTLRVGTSLVKAEMTVTTREIVPTDLPTGMGALPAVTEPADNPQSSAKVALGQKLFFETKLSGSGEMSCATCHDPGLDWTDGKKTPLGSDNLPLLRNSPTILNAAHGTSQFWDGRAATLEDQAKAVFDNSRELGTDFSAFLRFVNGSSDYTSRFTQAFGAAPSTAAEAKDLSAKAIASFMRAQVTGDSAFDLWVKGNSTALSRDAKIGLGVFVGSANCASCHSGPAFTDNQFHNIGIPGSGTKDRGRFDKTGVASDNGAFKTPGLRNVANTAPYFHDGSKATLGAAIRHYEDVDSHFPNLSAKLEPRSIDGLADLLFVQAFLKSLTGATPSLAP